MNRFYHLSIDDVSSVFVEIYRNVDTYQSIFDNSMLSFLKKCHCDYGVSIALFCFGSIFENTSIISCLRKFKEELEGNSDWLTFNFHGWTAEIERDNLAFYYQYDYTMNCLNLIGGGKETSIRLNSFQGSKEQCEYILMRSPKTIFLSADDRRFCYFLNPEQNNRLFDNGVLLDEMLFVKTTSRMESKWYLFQMLKAIVEKRLLVVFTHEIWLSPQHKHNWRSVYVKAMFRFTCFLIHSFSYNKIK